MGFWNFLGGKKEKSVDYKKPVDFLDYTKTLVMLAKGIAVSSYTTIVNKLPVIKSIAPADNVNWWDLIMTVAGVGTAILTSNIGAEKRNYITDIVSQELKQLHEHGHGALLDFNNFVVRNVNQGIELEVAIGLWVIWNLKGGQPTYEEVQPAGVIGKFLLSSFGGYFNSTSH
ncbi:MAG: hypothetical protein PHW74_14285 [Desulfobacca sp.]|nr:hypothetical protein [Desulfobacca sp.]